MKKFLYQNFKIGLNHLKKNNNEKKIVYVLFHKEQFKYLKTTHSYHLVDQSPWPLFASISGLLLTSGFVSYMHNFKGGFGLLTTGFLTLFYVFYCWWRDVVWEATFEDQHSAIVQKGIKFGMLLFIASEVMFFFAIFWSFFHERNSTRWKLEGTIHNWFN